MSDLLPLVAAALQDKIALDANKEIAALREELGVAHSVEVLRARDHGAGEDEDGPAVVYASAPFESGKYGRNPNLWEVTLKQNTSTTCKLADLRDCHVCVGGGFPVASLHDRLPNAAPYEGWLHTITVDANDGMTSGEDDDFEDVVGGQICFCPHSTWLTIWIRGWPREEWEAKILADDLNPDDFVEYLVDEVAARYPDATVAFKEVSFVAKSVYGALKRLLPAARKAEVRGERARVLANQNPTLEEFVVFVSRELRDQGVDAGPELFLPQLQVVLGVLIAVGLQEKGENDENVDQIRQTVAICVRFLEERGDESLEEIGSQALISAREAMQAAAQQEDEGGSAGAAADAGNGEETVEEQDS